MSWAAMSGGVMCCSRLNFSFSPNQKSSMSCKNCSICFCFRLFLVFGFGILFVDFSLYYFYAHQFPLYIQFPFNINLNSIVYLNHSFVSMFTQYQNQTPFIYTLLYFFIMSTLAAARADNFYISKNYNPENIPPKKSDLREDKPFQVVQGQRVGGGKVRYQTPFHVRCEGCQNMVAKGVRFNAIKTWVGNFHSTKIYEFRMKCPQCIQKFVVRTDPENCDYIYVSGAKRIFQTKDCTDLERIRDQSHQQKIREDPFFKLQNQVQDKQTYRNMQQTIEKLQQINERGDEDFQLNRLLRRKIRQSKQEQKEYLKQKNEKNIFIPLLSGEKEDEQEADKVEYKSGKLKLIKKEEKPLSDREKLKEKMKKMNPNFQKLLKTQIKSKNKPVLNVTYRK